MAPLNQSSVRSRKARPTVLIPFRDDAGLVAVRYERAVQAEPPVPLPPPRTLRRSGLSLRTPSDISQSSQRSAANNANNITARCFPVVVVPPGLAPPVEQHPALRDQTATVETNTLDNQPAVRNSPSSISETDAWKRDSALASPTTTCSSVTVQGDDYETDSLYDKLGLLDDTFVVERPAIVSVIPWVHETASVNYSLSNTYPSRLATAAQTNKKRSSFDSPPLQGFASVDLLASHSQELESTAAPAVAVRHVHSPTKRLVRSLSLRAGFATNKTRKRSSIGSGCHRQNQLPGSGSTPIMAMCVGSPRSPRGSVAQLARIGPPATPATETSPWSSPGSAPAKLNQSPVNPYFSPLSVAIPDDCFLEDDFMTKLSFSQRGSVMFGGRRAVSDPTVNIATTSTPSQPLRAQSQSLPRSLPALEQVISACATMTTTATATATGTTTTTTTTTTSIVPTITTTAPNIADSAQPISQVASAERNSTASTGDTMLSQASHASHATNTTASTTATPSIRLMSVDAEKDSQKVRSLYDSGDALNWEDGGKLSPLGERCEADSERLDEEAENDLVSELQPPVWGTPRSTSSSLTRPDSAVRRNYELAGGIEDWEDVDGRDVDRYGFISPRRPDSRVGTPTELKSAQNAPRRRNVLLKRDLSGLSEDRTPSRKVSARSLNTQNSGFSTRSRRSTRSAIRQASNYLPHNRNRRWMDEAGEMLTVASGLQDAAEEAKVERISEAIKKKEATRSEKWRKMAKVVKRGTDGEGMEFEFDVKNSKLIERTWKGIPDRWRAAAWYSFLATSARSRNDLAPDDEIIGKFHKFQGMGSPDDVQIDLDVPRTISRHIMFRRRYRGGQRLLFRVLHALSLYFPDVGYVQGMASLAATLLCYYDEEKCFVMLVRMWKLRGLEQLYQPGFEGLMGALNELESQWLKNKDVAGKLAELAIDPTAYGTRWYLTLFNLSIPFQAQLRVWDVFLLLGDQAVERPILSQSKGGEKKQPAVTGIEVIHATSTALINALGEVLLDSDFENAMKALTSWIPIKDEDLLMKVTKAEWKVHQGRKRA